jgi:Domain of unknown function (DUF4276)
VKIALYIEGGGSRDQKVALRQGFEKFFAAIRQSASNRRLGIKFVLCGSLDETVSKFQNACDRERDVLPLLLVDSDGAVRATPVQHLTPKHPQLAAAVSEHIHMMVQVMETWLIADAQALSQFYGQGFHSGALPETEDLESVSKVDIEQSLKRATAKTQKGEYHKVRHASVLLERIDPQNVRVRCRHCMRLFRSLEELVSTIQP